MAMHWLGCDWPVVPLTNHTVASLVDTPWLTLHPVVPDWQVRGTAEAGPAATATTPAASATPSTLPMIVVSFLICDPSCVCPGPRPVGREAVSPAGRCPGEASREDWRHRPTAVCQWPRIAPVMPLVFWT